MEIRNIIFALTLMFTSVTSCSEYNTEVESEKIVRKIGTIEWNATENTYCMINIPRFDLIINIGRIKDRPCYVQYKLNNAAAFREYYIKDYEEIKDFHFDLKIKKQSDGSYVPIEIIDCIPLECSLIGTLKVVKGKNDEQTWIIEGKNHIYYVINPINYEKHINKEMLFSICMHLKNEYSSLYPKKTCYEARITDVQDIAIPCAIL